MHARGSGTITRLALALLAIAVLPPARAGTDGDPAQDRVQIAPEPANVREALGTWLPTVETPRSIETARLRVVAAEEAERTALQSADRIAGYPVEGALAALSADAVRPLARVLLSASSYGDVLVRCAEREQIGLRFTSDAGRVEIALGRTCRGVLWVAPGADADGAPTRGGGTLTEAASRTLQRRLRELQSADAVSRVWAPGAGSSSRARARAARRP